MVTPAMDAMPRDLVRVLTVDDYAPFLGMARGMVAATSGFVSAGEVGSGSDACNAIDRDEPELVLIDIRMPGMDGIAVSDWIRRFHPSVVVVLITADDLSTLPAAAFRCGAAAVVRKQDLRPSLLTQLWRAHGPD